MVAAFAGSLGNGKGLAQQALVIVTLWHDGLRRCGHYGTAGCVSESAGQSGA